MLISCTFLTSCDDSTESKTEELEVLSYRTPCFRMFQTLCFVTKNSDKGVEESFSNTIEGFNFIWGHTYQLSLKVSDIKNPPADGSSVKYELKAIISDTEDSIGTNYEYKLVELLDRTFTKESDTYYFLGQSFECQVGVDCDGLVNLNNSGGLVNLVFEYIGNGKISLVQWN